MKIELKIREKEDLELQRGKERARRVANRIKAVLLNAEGWTQKQIAQTLRIRYATVQDQLDDYKNSKKLKPKNRGSRSHLTLHEMIELMAHLEANNYIKAEHICVYVEQMFDAKFTVSGMTKRLESHKFSFKKLRETPAKADPQKQAKFIRYYGDLLNTLSDEPVEFADAVHSTMATKIALDGFAKDRTSSLLHSSRTRITLLRSINLETMEVTIAAYETIDSKVMEKHFGALRKKYSKASKIHQIVDRGPYSISKETKLAAEKYGVVLHHLSPYSPNLNPIEQLWKVMNEFVRNNRAFKNAVEFKRATHAFFAKWPEISHSMIDRINDNFQSL